jgi:hypothetical protein
MRLVVLHLALLALAGCKVDVDFDNTRFMCADGVCPDGYECVDAVCVVSEGGDGDGGAGATDGGDADAMAPLQACLDQFGGAPGYQLCAENVDSCEFFHATGDGTQITCDEVCPVYGATCVESYDATAGETQCTRDTAEEGCVVAHSSQICVCTRDPA